MSHFPLVTTFLSSVLSLLQHQLSTAMTSFNDASGFSQHQGMINQFPPVSPTPLPLPQPIRTDHSHPNGAFVQNCFCHLPGERATQLRTIVQHLIDLHWWRQGHRPPSVTELDHFVDETNTGTFKCLFCMTQHPDLEAAHTCVKVHLNIAS